MSLRARSKTWLALGAGAFVLLALFAFVPLALVLGSALARGGAPFAEELADAGAREALVNTTALGLAVTLVAVPIGTALAWLFERTDLFATERARARAIAWFAMPVAIPPYLLGVAWALLANGRNGLLNRVSATPWVDVYGWDGIVLVLATTAYPFALLSVRAALRRADPSLEEAARVSGAGPARVLADVTLPLVAPAIAAAAGLVFVFTTAAFAVPYLFGSGANPPIRFLTTRIYQLVMLGGAEQLEHASALAVLLLAVSVAAQAIASWIAGRRSTVQVSGKTARPSSVRLGRLRPWLFGATLGFGALFLALPLATIAWTSLQRSFADPLSLTFAQWSAVLGRGETLRAFGHSIGLALASGLVGAVLGLVLARLAKQGGRGAELVASSATVPYAVPGTVLAIGLILAFSREIRVVFADWVTLALHLPGTLGMLLAAYGVKYLAFGVRGARAALDQLHPSLEEAARTSGAGPTRSFFDVIVPLVSPAIGAAFVLVAMQCLSELTMSVLLFGPGTETSGTLLFELQSYADPPAAAVVATAIVLLVLGGDFVARRLQRAAEGGRG
ncbi:iron ABC transporter permease [Myxococcota bacterium]|nr:iron ABC transporter permease [Myxococcota bacterium]